VAAVAASVRARLRSTQSQPVRAACARCAGEHQSIGEEAIVRAPSQPSLHAKPITGPMHGAIPSEAPTVGAAVRGALPDPPQGPSHRPFPRDPSRAHHAHPATRPRAPLWRRAHEAPLGLSPGPPPDFPNSPLPGDVEPFRPALRAITGRLEERHYDEALFLSPALRERHSAWRLPAGALWVASGPIVTQISGHLARLAAWGPCGEGGRCPWQ